VSIPVLFCRPFKASPKYIRTTRVNLVGTLEDTEADPWLWVGEDWGHQRRSLGRRLGPIPRKKQELIRR